VICEPGNEKIFIQTVVTQLTEFTLNFLVYSITKAHKLAKAKQDTPFKILGVFENGSDSNLD
jgi:hypothetical protein